MSIQGTTIIAVKQGAYVAMAADGQATQGDCIVKSNIKKIRKICNGSVLAGFAGSVGDAITLLNFFEKSMDAEGDITKAALSLANQWRTNRMYRYLHAELLVADTNKILLISGTGEVIEPEDDIMAIGSGGFYALAAGRAFVETRMPYRLEDIAKKSLEIASKICIYTNSNIIVETLNG